MGFALAPEFSDDPDKPTPLVVPLWSRHERTEDIDEAPVSLTARDDSAFLDRLLRFLNRSLSVLDFSYSGTVVHDSVPIFTGQIHNEDQHDGSCNQTCNGHDREHNALLVLQPMHYSLRQFQSPFLIPFLRTANNPPQTIRKGGVAIPSPVKSWVTAPISAIAIQVTVTAIATRVTRDWLEMFHHLPDFAKFHSYSAKEKAD